MRNRTLFFLLLMSLTASLHAAKKPATGTVCIAPFRVPEIASGPNMSFTPAPTKYSTFEFRFDKKLKASVKQGEMISIDNVPADRSVMVGVRLDGRPFESFRLDLRKEPGRKECLWLYPGYWHWITGWDEKRGCRCK